MSLNLLIEHAKRGNVAAMSELFEDEETKPKDIDCKDGLGNTAMHWAANGGFEDAIEFVIEKGSKAINERNIKGETPLHRAAFKGHPEACEVLFKAGADVTITNNEGQVAAQLAHNDPEVRRWCVHKPAVELLAVPEVESDGEGDGDGGGDGGDDDSD